MEEITPTVDVAEPARRGRIRATQAISYLIAGGLMIFAITQARQNADLTSRLRVAQNNVTNLRASNALANLRLIPLDPHDPAYGSAKILIAWDTYEHRGIVAMKDLPAPPAGQSYQLWVLDPNALAPVHAGVIAGSRRFDVPPIGTDKPGFAVSLEAAGDQPAATGPILFAVAPGSY